MSRTSSLASMAAWAPDDVAEVEDALAVRLPAPFRRYLLRDGAQVLGKTEMLAASAFLTALGERLLGHPVRASKPFPMTLPEMTRLLDHYERGESGMGLDRLLFPGDGWLPIAAHGWHFDQANAFDVLVTAGDFRGRVLYADYGYQWWWPYVTSPVGQQRSKPAVMTFAEFRRARDPGWIPSPWCPDCGTRAIRVIYGRPAPAVVALARAGEIMLGGCLLAPECPRWWCRGCGSRLGQLAGIGESRIGESHRASQ